MRALSTEAFDASDRLVLWFSLLPGGKRSQPEDVSESQRVSGGRTVGMDVWEPGSNHHCFRTQQGQYEQEYVWVGAHRLRKT